MAEGNVQPDLPTRPSTTSASLPPHAVTSATRQRFPQRQSSRPDYSQSPRPAALDRRRSSLLSYTSFEDASSLAGDIVNPRTRRRPTSKQDVETTHWHSTPLAFALLPAVGGMLHKNGSSFTTDILLLILAAIFMNWSIRLPWDWYFAAQTLLRDTTPEYEDTIVEEDEPDEHAVETASSVDGSPKSAAADNAAEAQQQKSASSPNSAREEAAAALRRQEIFALGALFVFPVMAAYLLHVIRAQLSLPSTSLVSDYNICIFVLAAEIMPCRQVIRLLANRTLHLQRTATGLDEPFASANSNHSADSELMDRIAALETKLADHQLDPPTLNIAHKADVSDLSTEMRKRYEPRLEGLERAVRRYEKRSTTLAMLTEQRLNSLETRLQEALSLAAVAAQHSQKRGVFAAALETLSTIISIPLKMMWSVSVWPFLVLEDLYEKVKVVMLGPVPPPPAKKRPRDGGGGGGEEKPRLKSSMRKVSR